MRVSADLIAGCVVEAARARNEDPARYPHLSEGVLINAALALSKMASIKPSAALEMLTGERSAPEPVPFKRQEAGRKSRDNRDAQVVAERQGRDRRPVGAHALQRSEERGLFGTDRVLAAMRANCGPDGVVLLSRGDLAKAADVIPASFEYFLDALVCRKAITVMAGGHGVRRLIRLVGDYSAAVKAKPLPQEPLLPAPAPRPARARYVSDLPPQPAPAPPTVAAEPVALVDDTPIAGARPNSILALGYRTCRWPTNDPPAGRGDLTTFCCAETGEGETYCPTHAGKARGASTGRTWTPEQRAAAAARAISRATLKAAQGATA